MTAPNAYNLTKVGDINTTVQFIQNVNEILMRGWFGTMVLIVIFFITFMSFMFSTRQPVKSLTGASFIACMMSLLFYVMELTSVLTVWIFLIMTALGVAFWNLD